MSATDRSQKLNALLRGLKSRYEPAEPTAREPIDELIYSMLLWQSNATKADRAMRRIEDAAADVNELRVFRPEHLELILGERYPLVEERCRRIVCVLNEVYKKAHEVSLAPIIAMPKRDGRRALETIEGMPAWVSARLTLLVLGGHAIPVDERTLPALVEVGALEAEPALDPARASAVLERMVKAADGPGVAALLHAWSEDGAPTDVAGRSAKSPARTSAKKKTAPRKKTKKRTTTK